MSPGEAPRGAVLVGFMGSGKSSVGRELARRLKSDFVEVDETIETAAGKPIAGIFASEGEEGFRRREKAAVAEAISVPGRVVATGGGAFEDEDNRRLLKSYASVFFLDVTPETVLRRLAGDATRPMLFGDGREARVRELMERRRAAYQEADFTVSTDNRTIGEVVDHVIALLGGPQGRVG